MAQRVVHQVTRVLAPGCVPLFLTDGLKDYATALLTHFGDWRQPQRRQAKGPMPKPRWVPLPELLYAQVVKSYRRRRLVGVTHRVVFGTQLALSRSWRPVARRSIRPLWSASTSISVSASRRLGAGSTRSAGRSGLARAVDTVSRLSQLRLAPREPSPTIVSSRSHERSWLSQAVAAVYPGDGGWPDRPCVDAERSPPVSGAAVATATDSLKQEAGCGAWCGGAQCAQIQAKGHGRGLENRFRVMMTG
jgi:hypothetical protein